jgi:serine O-acetyltransferase
MAIRADDGLDAPERRGPPVLLGQRTAATYAPVSLSEHGSGLTLVQEIALDYRRYRATGTRLLSIPITQGFWAGMFYRIGRRARACSVPWPLRLPGKVLGVVLLKISEVVSGISLPPGAEIGSGLYIGHFGPTLIHPNVRLGRNCSLSQGVSIAAAARGRNQSSPTLGDRVFVGPNAVLIGDITIGDDAVIGAGAIVLESVPDRAVVVGNPARVVSRTGSFDLVFYDRMESDPARLASLQDRCLA